ncbi:MAG TPA: amidohydrolase family protein [Bryobacteraceae bacterium]|nr:amidohydrolase family protein [Bryobacteraceae bacterium]
MASTLIGEAQTQHADVILVNGRVFTAVSGNAWAEAIAIRDTRMQAVGSVRQIRSLAGPKTREIDLDGRFVIPGFNDAHIHLGTNQDAEVIGFGRDGEPTCERALASVERAVQNAPEGRLLVVLIGSSAFFDPQCTATSLDRIASRRPVVLHTWSAHGSIVNRAAAQYLKVREEDPPVLGGFFGKDMNSRKWDGVVHEYATFRLSDKMAAYDERALTTRLTQAARYGITSLQAMSWNPARLVDHLAAVKPLLRIRVIPMLIPDSGRRPVLKLPTVPSHVAHRVSVSGVKWVLDGSPIERSAAMRQQDVDAPRTSVNFSRTDIEAMFREARRNKAQLILHAVGDRAIDAALDALEATGGKSAWSNRRVRIEHANAFVLDQSRRAKELGVILVMNPTHLNFSDRQLLASVQQAGIPLVLASDGPMNPYVNLRSAVTYGKRPAEAITPEQALIAYTRTAAYAEFRDDKGTLQVGQVADLAVLSQNIFDITSAELPRTESLLTMVGGVVVYAAPPFSH